jgi:hypothetical protein
MVELPRGLVVRLPSGRTLRLAAWGLLLAALVYGSWRGIARGFEDSKDLAVGYGAARAWLSGQNPYDSDVLKRDLLTVGGADVAVGSDLDRLRNVYFPMTMPVFTPLAVFDWPTVRLVVVGVNVIGAAFIALGLVRWLGWSPTAPRALLLSAFVVALAPAHATIAAGQTGIVATALVVGGMLLERSARPVGSGFLFGLATAVKIQIGLPFLAYLVWRRRTTALASAAIVIVALTTVGVAGLVISDVPWLDAWTHNLGSLSGPGGINDPGPLNPDGYTLINLQHLLATAAGTGSLTEPLTYGLVASAALALIYLTRGSNRGGELVALATVAVLGLLVTYHRYYDAVLLALPIAWGLWALGTVGWRRGALALVLVADFVFPFQSALRTLQQGGSIPEWLTQSPVWGSLIMVQHTWALVLLVGVLLWSAANDESSTREDEQPVAITIDGS